MTGRRVWIRLTSFKKIVLIIQPFSYYLCIFKMQDVRQKHPERLRN